VAHQDVRAAQVGQNGLQETVRYVLQLPDLFGAEAAGASVVSLRAAISTRGAQGIVGSSGDLHAPSV
jgi:hypothetical protein